jgi:hypothetical protein
MDGMIMLPVSSYCTLSATASRLRDVVAVIVILVLMDHVLRFKIQQPLTTTGYELSSSGFFICVALMRKLCQEQSQH